MIGLKEVAKFYKYDYIKLRTIPYIGRCYIGYSKGNPEKGIIKYSEILCKKEDIELYKKPIIEKMTKEISDKKVV